MKNARYRITIVIDDADGTLVSVREANAFAGTIGTGPEAQWDPLLTPTVGVVAVEPTEAGSESASGREDLTRATPDVYTLEVEGRRDGLYVFAGEHDRDAFATVIESNGSETLRRTRRMHDEASTRNLIAAEIESIFLVDAVVEVRATDARDAFESAGELERLAAGTEGRVRLTLSRRPRPRQAD